MWSNKFWRFCLNFWILPRFFGVWAWNLTELCHSSAPCFSDWSKGTTTSYCPKNLWPTLKVWNGLLTGCKQISIFLTLFLERIRPMLWKIECFCDHCYLLNWYGVFLMSWHLFDELNCCPCELFSQRFSLPSLSSIVLCRSRRCRPLWTNYSVSFDSIFGTLLHN